MTRVVVALFVLGLLSGMASAAPVPKALKKKPLRAKIEPLPGDKVYTADFDDVPFSKVAEWYEKYSGLMYISKDVPKLNISLHATDVCMPELFAQLDDLLYPQGWVLARRATSFSSIPVKDLARYAQHIPRIELNELDRRALYSPVQVVVTVGQGGIDAGTKVANGITEDGFQMRESGADKLIVGGLAKDVRKFVGDMGGHIKK